MRARLACLSLTLAAGLLLCACTGESSAPDPAPTPAPTP
ncbi:endo alpha-1,4 polygalactosaminidase, partial [Gemmiger formicilis]|nr:endo alpha-1,4 polygalactosaminidase [Gemmiger formicilis]